MKEVNDTLRLAVGNALTARTVISLSIGKWLEHAVEIHEFQCSYYGLESRQARATAVLIAEAETIAGQLVKGLPTAVDNEQAVGVGS